MLYVTRHYLNQRTVVDQTLPFNAASGHQEMPGSLIVAPGYYKGYVYNAQSQSVSHCALNFTQPGLYQIFFPQTEGPNGSTANIYYRINASTALGLASAVATLHSYGNDDDALSVAAKLAKIMNSPLSVMCGSSAGVLIELARQVGYQARLAAMLTHDTPNHFMDGHTIAEIYVDGRWVAFDASLNFVMCNPSTNMLSLADACEGVWAGTTEFFEIAPFQFDAKPTVLGQWNPWGWCLAESLYDDAERAQALRRLMRIPAIQDADGYFYFYLPPGSEQGLAYALTFGWRQLTREAFMARFYPA